MYLQLETEAEDQAHADDEEQELKRREYTETVTNEITGEVKYEKTRMEFIVCSCGSRRCYLIDIYGLPRPVYEAEIRPLRTIFEKNARAKQLKLGGL